VSLMFSTSREQTESHRVPNNEDEENTLGRIYGNQSHSVNACLLEHFKEEYLKACDAFASRNIPCTFIKNMFCS
jgi:hypothetical protein